MNLHTPLNSKFMYKRLARIRAKAKAVGLLYLTGIFLLGILALLPTVKVEYLCVIPGLGIDKMIWNNMDLSWDIDTISRILYLVMLINVAFIIPITSLKRLKWLFTRNPVKGKKFRNVILNETRQANVEMRNPQLQYVKTATDDVYDMSADQRRYYGFNRNVYAMKELATLYSWSFALLIVVNTLLCMLNGSYAGKELFDFGVILEKAVVCISDLSLGINIPIPIIAIALVLGFLTTLIGRMGALKVRLFTPDDGEGVDAKAAREATPALALRTLMQFIAIVVVPMFLLQVNTVNVFAANVLQGKFELDLTAIVQGVFFFVWLAVCYCPIIYCRKCIVTEYNLPEQNIDHFYMLGVSIIALICSVALFFVTDMFKFDFKSVTNLNILIIIGALLVVTLVTNFLTKSSVRYAEYDSVIAMVTQDSDFEEINWKYAFSDNYVGGEERYADGDEIGSVIE